LATFTFVSVKQESVSMVVVYTNFCLPVWWLQSLFLSKVTVGY
jgi:hypothetical protein